MKLKRLCFILVLITTIALYFFNNGPLTLAILMISVFLPLISIFLVIITYRNLSIKLLKPIGFEKGKAGKISIELTNTGLISINNVTYTVSCKNVRTGEEIVNTYIEAIGGNKNKKIDFDFTPMHSGKFEVSIVAPMLNDNFGLLAKKIFCTEKKTFIVLPNAFDMTLKMFDGGVTMLDSDTYSSTKPGNDPGETFAMREYIPGDSIKNIHWKLSSKLDKVMIKELGLPIIHRLIVLFETGSSKQNDFSILDCTNDILASVMRCLTEQEIPFVIGWNDCSNNDLITKEPSTLEDCESALQDILSVAPQKSESIVDIFSKNNPHCQYSHVLVISPIAESNMQRLYNGNIVTLITHETQANNSGLQSDGTYISTFSTGTYACDLCALEV